MARANAGHAAALRRISRRQGDQIVEPAHGHAHAAQQLLLVQPERLDQESAVLRGRKAERLAAAVDRVHAGNELNVIPSVFAKKSIDLPPVPRHVRRHDGQDIVIHAVPLQTRDSRLHAAEAALAGRVHAQRVLNLRRAVERHAQQIPVPREKRRPFVVNQRAVRLHAAVNGHVPAPEPPDIVLQLFKKGQPRDHRLASLKDQRKRVPPLGQRLERALEQLCARFIAHYAVIRHVAVLRQVVIKAIPASQIAQAGRGLDHDR